MGDSISSDIVAKLTAWIIGIMLHQGQGFSQLTTTLGDSSTRTLIASATGFYPAVTVINTGTLPVNIGYGGTANIPLVAGASMTLRYKRFPECALCYNDLGNAGVPIAVMS